MLKTFFLNRTLIFLFLAIIFLPTVWARTNEFEGNRLANETYESGVNAFDLRAYECVAVDAYKQIFEGYGRNARAEALLGCESVSHGCRIIQCEWF